MCKAEASDGVMAMAALGDPHDIHTPDKFREYVEALEVAREFLEAGTPALFDLRSSSSTTLQRF